MSKLMYLADRADTTWDSPQIWHPPTLHGVVSKGYTYCKKLSHYTKYSAELKDTIWECLYEVPDHRPTLERLKEVVGRNIISCLENLATNGEEEETWESLLNPAVPAPPPPPAPIVPPPPPAPVVRRRRRRQRRAQIDPLEEYIPHKYSGQGIFEGGALLNRTPQRRGDVALPRVHPPRVRRRPTRYIP